jgi:Zn-dependent protease
VPESGFSDRIDSLPDVSTVSAFSRLPRLWWLNVFLFVLTVLTSTAFGSALVESFAHNRPLTLDLIADAYLRLIHLDGRIWSGLVFSLPLLAILLAHELGHYLECRRRNVDASLPYFLPSPLFFGTFGAFIRIRSPIYSREGLFDIGIRGPLAGFVTLVPLLAVGIKFSKTVAASPSNDAIVLGTPLILRLFEKLRFPGISDSQVLLHPLAMAAWAGLFATALNLLPIGQLDGGHIVYAAGAERWHRRISLAFVVVLAVAGFFYWPWWIWGVGTFFFGRRHPLVYDTTPLSRGRLLLCLAALVIFILSATVVPVK